MKETDDYRRHDYRMKRWMYRLLDLYALFDNGKMRDESRASMQ